MTNQKLKTVGRSKQLGRRLMLVSIGSIITIVSFFLVTSYFEKLESAEKAELKYLSGVIFTLSKQIDGDAHEHIINTYKNTDAIHSNTQDSAYHQIHKTLRKAYEANQLESDIYTLVLRDTREPNQLENATFFGVTSGLVPYFKHDYTPPKILIEKYKEGTQIHAYTDNHGVWISAFAPIKNAKGEVVAVVQADKRFDTFITSVRNKIIQESLISLVAVVIIAILIAVLLNRITSILSKSEQALIKSYSEIQETQQAIIQFTEEVKRGNLKAEIHGINNENLSSSLSSMQQDLFKAKQINEDQKWVAEGINRLNNELSTSLQTPAALYTAVINELTDYIDLDLGLLMVRKEDDDATFEIKSTYGFPISSLKQVSFNESSGLIGKVVRNQAILEKGDLPKDYSYIATGLGRSQPKCILFVPLITNNEVEGILEFAGFRPFKKREKKYFEKVSETIASALMAIKNNKRTERLLEETQLLNNDLKIKEATLQQKVEEIKDANENLNKTRDEALKAKDEAEQATKAKSEFLANMSHELRTPLNGVIGYAQILMEAEGISKENKEKVGIINSCGEHLLGLINNVLDFSKIEADKFELINQEFELRSFLKEIFDMFEFRMKEKNLNYQLNVPKEIPSNIIADKGKLKQCLINLLGNAMKFTDNGKVSIEVMAERSSMSFFIKDTGIGIPDSKLKSILDPFAQVNDPKTNEGGTGLGLAITHKFIEIMKGELFVESTVGKGSTFSFTIPIEYSSDDAILTESATQVIGIDGGYSPKILVMDDNPVNVSLASEILQKVGFKIDVAENGKIGLDKVATFKPDMVLVDVRMPVMGGLEFTSVIRKNKQHNNLKLIAVTASATEQDKKSIMKHGCNDFIPKPYRKQLLLDAIAKHLKIEYTRGGKKIETSNTSEHEIPQKVFSIEDNRQQINEWVTDKWLANLLHLIEQGDISEVEQLINQTSFGETSAIQSFKAWIENHLKEFELEEIASFLMKLSPQKA